VNWKNNDGEAFGNQFLTRTDLAGSAPRVVQVLTPQRERRPGIPDEESMARKALEFEQQDDNPRLDHVHA
jgi:hypothetical protein